MLAYITSWPAPAPLTASTFDQLGQYANSSGNRAYVLRRTRRFLVIAVHIASTHFAYSRRDDQSELAYVAWLSTKK